jgi:hypothetical protein
MTLTLDLTSEVVDAITEAATRQGRSREELAAAALQRLFSPQEDIAALLADEDADDALSLSERGFLMAAEGTRHIWDTPEEDEAWAHL